MYTALTDRDAPARLRKFDSAVVLERLDSSVTSSYASGRHATGLRSVVKRDRGEVDVDELGEPSPTPIVVDLSIRFGRLGLLTALSVSVIAALTLTFHHAVVLGHFDPSTKDANATKELLDNYNSYTSNVATVFGRPIEMFVTLAVQVLVLRVLAGSFLREETSWKVNALTFVLSTGVGYMISNGLNALNVQTQPPTIKSKISAADLRYIPELSTSAAAGRATSLAHSFSERQQGNSIFNTALRNLVLPIVAVNKPRCDHLTSLKTMGLQDLPSMTVQHDVSRRDWHERVLPEAIDPKQLRVIVNPTNQSANQNVHSQDLPMDASIAADLFILWREIASLHFDWVIQSSGPGLSNPNTVKFKSMARAYGLLPPEAVAGNETAQREWFLRESQVQLTQAFKFAKNTVRSNLVTEYSSVDLSPTMRFDAITVDIEVDPASLLHLPKTYRATPDTEVLPEYQCGPWAGKCMMPKPILASNASVWGSKVYDPPAQVSVFGSCVNNRGTEELVFGANASIRDCSQMSKTSMMVMSIGKRFLADSLTQSQNRNFLNDPITTVAKNVRRIYSLTVAKLSWKLSDLAVDFNAECADDVGLCKAIRFPVNSKENNSQQQELIVGVDALPLDLLLLPSSTAVSRSILLVHEPQYKDGGEFDLGYDSLMGEPLLPHNIGKVSWLMEEPLSTEKYCNVFFEERVQAILDNHMYIEHGLQTAYTSATFFLLQNSVVKDVLKANDVSNTLSFQQNSLSVALVASIPPQNAWLTLGGCAVLVVSLCCVVVWARVTSNRATGSRMDEIGRVTNPHVVARVVLDSACFPPELVNRRVISDTNVTDVEQHEAQSVDGYLIDGLTLRPSRDGNGSA